MAITYLIEKIVTPSRSQKNVFLVLENDANPGEYKRAELILDIASDHISEIESQLNALWGNSDIINFREYQRVKELLRRDSYFEMIKNGYTALLMENGTAAITNMKDHLNNDPEKLAEYNKLIHEYSQMNDTQKAEFLLLVLTSTLGLLSGGFK